MTLENRLIKLENRIKQNIPAILCVGEVHETIEEAKKRFFEINGITFPSYGKIIIYRKIQAKEDIV